MSDVPFNPDGNPLVDPCAGCAVDIRWVVTWRFLNAMGVYVDAFNTEVEADNWIRSVRRVPHAVRITKTKLETPMT